MRGFDHAAITTFIGNSIIGAAILGILVACAAPPQIHTRSEPGTNFSGYKTFALAEIPDPGVNNPMSNANIRQRLERAIARELSGKGLRRVAAGQPVDLLVHYWLAVNAPPPSQPEPSASSPYAWRGGPGDPRGQRKGALVVELEDTRTSRGVWRAAMTGTLGDDAEQNLDLADAAITDAFKDYPPLTPIH